MRPSNVYTSNRMKTDNGCGHCHCDCSYFRFTQDRCLRPCVYNVKLKRCCKWRNSSNNTLTLPWTINSPKKDRDKGKRSTLLNERSMMSSESVSSLARLLDETKQVFLIVPNIPNSSANFIKMTIKVTEAVAQTSFLEAFSIPLLSGVQHPGGYMMMINDDD